MELREIASGIYGLGSYQVNWYLIEDGGKLSAVDAGLPGFARHLDNDLAQLGLALADIEAVVLTHSDGDHTGVAPGPPRRGRARPDPCRGRCDAP
jgi:glyoxylase-like metal-dependent hydrolase (beta-lactamase superfamily II)